jgi:hypothetical protein
MLVVIQQFENRFTICFVFIMKFRNTEQCKLTC